MVEKQTQEIEKLPYQAPELQVHGSLTELTKSGPFTVDDMIAGSAISF